MTGALLSASVILLCWSLAASRLDRWHVTAPLVMVGAGALISIGGAQGIVATFNSEVAQRVAEIILALLLFTDATEIRGGIFGRQPGPAARLLLIALPLSMVLGVAAFALLIPGTSLVLALIVACIVVPTDFAPASSLVRDIRIPDRVRHLLNVESGYNDGVVAPFFLFGLALAGDVSHASSPSAALATAVPASVKAIAVGIGIGACAALAYNLAARKQWTTVQSTRIGLLALPLLAFALSTSWHGNGFVAAFVCGVVFKAFRRQDVPAAELETVDDIALLTTLGMWFAFGSMAVYAITEYTSWQIVVFTVLALTVVRAGPVLLSLIRSQVPMRERVLIAALGPRGTASIVFGLLAYNVLSDDAATVVLVATIWTVTMSVLLHGAGSSVLARWYAKEGAQ